MSLDLRFAYCPSLAPALLLLNDGDGSRNKLHSTVPGVGPGVQLAMTVKVVLTVEAFATEFAGEPRLFTVVPRSQESVPKSKVGMMGW
jgi:hypothetical protein